MDFQFLVFDYVEELDLVGSWELVGLLAEQKQCSSPKLVTLNTMTPVGEHGMHFIADVHFSEAEAPDVIFVPGGSGSRIAMEDPSVIAYLQEQSKCCKAILSVCTGSFLMQKSGLFKGRRATTHWAFLNHLKEDPDVTVVEQRFVHDGNIWSSGGVSAGMDMMLAFIAYSFGHDVAASVQLSAEYFPATTIYGRPFERRDISEYIRVLAQNA
ncbi:DJ-1/PfpI family protein [filamentous cyanobacterium CCT1]|nr:DJ-1/PfpI family protein [filamentous cyanobacterium CCT1]PSN80659.1 DJ-1/PfpI family protein [filamentous cyanobacterium CCP4]